MQVCVIKPTSVEDAREITETLYWTTAQLSSMWRALDVEIAQRIIDLYLRFLLCNQRKSAEDFELHLHYHTGSGGYFRRFPEVLMDSFETTRGTVETDFSL